ncbi:MAG: hypothetical protein CMJ32_10445 [Phycisphaerae bacterium]|nr:hypothetical protein [Phycisphaerae bacterium]
MKDLWYRFRTTRSPVGLHVSGRRLHLVQLQGRFDRRDEHAVNAAAVIDLKTDQFDRNVVAEQLARVFDAGSFSTRKCHVSLPSNSVQVQPVRLPHMPDKDLKEALRWEASERFGHDRDSIEVDYLRTGASLPGSESKEEVILVCSTHEDLNTWLEPIFQAGLTPVGLEPSFAASARALSRGFRRDADRNTVRAIVEVEHDCSTVMILQGSRIVFCKSLSLGGGRMDAAVQEHLKIDLETAAALRRARLVVAAGSKDASNVDPTADRAAFDATRGILQELAREISLCLRYYGVTFRGTPPLGVILSGAEALEPHLDEAIAEATSLQVDHDDNIGSLKRLYGSGISPRLGFGAGHSSWSAAIGLALRGVQEESSERRDEHVSRGRAA